MAGAAAWGGGGWEGGATVEGGAWWGGRGMGKPPRLVEV